MAEPEREPNGTIERRARYRSGTFAELVAAGWLMLKGYRILARRWKSRYGEIDLICIRGDCVVFVEVKRRLSMQDAQMSITTRQRSRVRDAALAWIAKHARYREHEIRFDLVFVVPRHWPHHIVDGL